MKRKALAVAAAGVVGAVAVALAPTIPPKLTPPCVARYPGEPEALCQRVVVGLPRTVKPLVPFSASDAVGWCRPIACDAKAGKLDHADLNPAYDYGDGRHYNDTGNAAVAAGVRALAVFP